MCLCKIVSTYESLSGIKFFAPINILDIDKDTASKIIDIFLTSITIDELSKRLWNLNDRISTPFLKQTDFIAFQEMWEFLFDDFLANLANTCNLVNKLQGPTNRKIDIDGVSYDFRYVSVIHGTPSYTPATEYAEMIIKKGLDGEDPSKTMVFFESGIMKYFKNTKALKEFRVCELQSDLAYNEILGPLQPFIYAQNETIDDWFSRYAIYRDMHPELGAIRTSFNRLITKQHDICNQDILAESIYKYSLTSAAPSLLDLIRIGIIEHRLHVKALQVLMRTIYSQAAMFYYLRKCKKRKLPINKIVFIAGGTHTLSAMTLLDNPALCRQRLVQLKKIFFSGEYEKWLSPSPPDEWLKDKHFKHATRQLGGFQTFPLIHASEFSGS